MKIIDLRSDTVSKPTLALRDAIFNAEVGDDCFGDDRATRLLEEYCADFFGKEAALFTLGGTMSNQIAMKTLTQPGDEIVLDASYHINYFEAAATSTFSGINFNLIHSLNGIYTVEDLQSIYSTKARWNTNYALPKVIVIENTVGSKGGVVFPLEEITKISHYAKSIGAYLYMDGARILHAVENTAIPLKTYVNDVDGLSMCFSKALGAPIGSIMVGSKAFIAKARKFRKWFGGDMHQSGIAAAGAYYAIKNHIGKIAEDHKNMKLLVAELNKIDKAKIIYHGTNIIYLDIGNLTISTSQFVASLEKYGIKCLAWNDKTVRFITHLNVSTKDILYTAKIITQLYAEVEFN